MNYAEHKRLQKEGLSSRAINGALNLMCVFGTDDFTKWNIKRLIESGEFHYKHKKAKNFGIKSYQELCRWAGVDTEVPTICCPRCHYRFAVVKK